MFCDSPFVISGGLWVVGVSVVVLVGEYRAAWAKSVLGAVSGEIVFVPEAMGRLPPCPKSRPIGRRFLGSVIPLFGWESC